MTSFGLSGGPLELVEVHQILNFLASMAHPVESHHVMRVGLGNEPGRSDLENRTAPMVCLPLVFLRENADIESIQARLVVPTYMNKPRRSSTIRIASSSSSG